MFARTSQEIRGRVQGSLALLVAVLIASMGCATAPKAPTASGPAQLSEIVVEADEGATVVSLVGLAEPVYNAFQQDDPARIVLDLASVRPGDVAEAIAVYDGTVEEVTIAGFENAGASSTRVEVSLAASAGYEVVALEDRLEIRIQAQAGAEPMASAAVPADVDPWTTAAGQEPSTDASEQDASVTDAAANEVAEVVPATPATALLGVSTESEGESLAALLEADGSIEGATWFALEDPDRLVVDLPGLSSQIASSRIEVGGEWISAIRIGQHDDKVRVVLDGETQGWSGFQDVQLVSTPDGLWVGMAGATAPVASGPAAEATPEVAETETEAVDATETAEADAGWTASSEVATASEESTELEAPAQDPWIETAEAAPVEITETAETVEEPTVELVESAEEPTAEIVETAEEPVAELAEATEAQATESVDTWSEGASPAAIEEAAQASLIVYGVQLESDAGADRVVIVTEGPADYVTTHPSADTTVVSIRGATIDPDAAVRIAPDQPGAVSLVTAFQQPGSSEPEVRVVIRSSAGSKAQVSQEGAMLFLSYPAGEQVAEALPMLSDVASAETPGAPPAAIDPNTDSIEILDEGGLADGKAYTGRRISLDFKDVEIDDVLRLIAEVSDLNIIAGDEVNGKVTIRLVDVPWDQALDVILLTRGLGFVRVGSVLRIAPSDMLKAEEEARLQERRAKEKLEDLVVKLQPVNYADVNEIEKMIKRLLTARGSVDVDERTNTVILKDIASVIDEATALIKAIDTQTPQVMIEAKIVEANLDFGKELGGTWAFGVQPFNDGFDDSSGDRRDERLGLGNDVVFHDNSLLTGFTDTFNHVYVSNPITSAANGLLDLGAFILDERLNIEARIEAAESYGEGKVVSSPRIVTLDNRKASIEQGVSIPFQTFENGDAKLEFIDAVLRLDVTPHITADRSIIMKLEIQRNAPDDSVQTPTGSPAIAKNEAETETLVKDGQTLVIGGIYIVDQSELESRVPYFHKIPLLGNAFKNNEVRDIRKELLVFVTPRIVVNPELGS